MSLQAAFFTMTIASAVSTLFIATHNDMLSNKSAEYKFARNSEGYFLILKEREQLSSGATSLLSQSCLVSSIQLEGEYCRTLY